MSRPEFEVAWVRIREAKSTLEEARELCARQRWRGCANRLYYACFYAALALLAVDGKGSSKHTGVRGLLVTDYIRTGLIAEPLGRFYHMLFEARLQADYVLEKPLPEENLPAWLESAGEFIESAELLIRQREADESKK
ncbi:MAG: HEPN domain-containing protein [Candidatus Hydrogenedens sp.]|nr:HEPN domain-containing protein [Candidatus Hydrogenedens sp.]